MPIGQSACFISETRTCHTINQKDSVFLIGSGSRQFEKDIDTIIDTLDKLGLEGRFALLSNKAKGLDVFCDKICSKIREAVFCVALLNSPIVSKHVEGTEDEHKPMRVPSANVYFEFGMAVALGKNVIPVIRKGFKLPFDVQHLDTIIYDNLSDLEKQLMKASAACLRRVPKQVLSATQESITLIYGPLYNEIDEFISRKDKFTPFSHSRYTSIVSQHKYLFDKLPQDLRKSVRSFYSMIGKFNCRISVADRRIHEIVVEQIENELGMPKESFQTVSVELETEGGAKMTPPIEQVLLWKTTPKRFLESQNSQDTVKKITYVLKKSDYKDDKIDSGSSLFNKCRKSVENDAKVALLRKTERNLGVKGKDLRERIGQFCQ